MTFANAVNEAAHRKGMGIGGLAKELRVTYEHVRKLCRGLMFPSRYLLAEICRILELDAEAMRTLIVADKLQRKYKGIPAELTGKSKRVAELEPYIDGLTDEQYDTVLDLVVGMKNRNRNKGVTAVDVLFGSSLEEKTKT